MASIDVRVMFLPGLLRLTTRPSSTGSLPTAKNNRNGLGRSLSCKRGKCAAWCSDYSHLLADLLGGQHVQSIIFTFGPMVLDRHIVALRKARLA